MNYGATPAEWAHWDLFLGLGTDLLPVVCQPGLPISPNSTLRSYGKVPSIISNGSVSGLANWTTRQTCDSDISLWSKNPDYGICLQNRIIRAIDVDIEDAELAGAVRRAICQWKKDLVWPIRYRENSSKFLLLFQMEPEHGKQRLTTSSGVIELLANGQQCLVAGSHPSGVRYQWGNSDKNTEQLPLRFPTLTLDEWEDLRDTLELLFAAPGNSWTTPRRMTNRNPELLVPIDDDPVVQYLRKHGWAKC